MILINVRGLNPSKRFIGCDNVQIAKITFDNVKVGQQINIDIKEKLPEYHGFCRQQYYNLLVIFKNNFYFQLKHNHNRITVTLNDLIDHECEVINE